MCRGDVVCGGTGPLPRAGAQLNVDCVFLLGGVAGAGAGRLRMPHGQWRPASGAVLIDVCLNVGPLQPRSSSLTVVGCQLGGFPART